MTVRRKILLENWRFDFDTSEIAEANSLLSKGVEPTRIAKKMNLSLREVMILMLSWSDKRWEWHKLD